MNFKGRDKSQALYHFHPLSQNHWTTIFAVIVTFVKRIIVNHESVYVQAWTFSFNFKKGASMWLTWSFIRHFFFLSLGEHKRTFLATKFKLFLWTVKVDEYNENKIVSVPCAFQPYSKDDFLYKVPSPRHHLRTEIGWNASDSMPRWRIMKLFDTTKISSKYSAVPSHTSQR